MEIPMKEKERVLSSKEKKGGVETGETSFRVYYGEKGAAVPFMWESQPGTPKHPIFDENIAPPLTPPPSYNSSTTTNSSGNTQRPRIFSAFISSNSRKCRRSNVTSTKSLSFSSYSGPLSWSRSSSSSSSISLSSSRQFGERIRYKAQRRISLLCSFPGVKKFRLFDDNESKIVVDSLPTSTIWCFGFSKHGSSLVKGMKNAIFTIKGR